MGLGERGTHRLDAVIAETLDGQLVFDQGNGAMDLAPQDHVGRNQSVTYDAGKMWFLLIAGKEGELRKILVQILVGAWCEVDETAGQDQAGRLSDQPPVS